MFYCEIDKNNICFHVTKNELPLSETIILSDERQLGRKWNGTDWEDVPEPVEEPLESDSE